MNILEESKLAAVAKFYLARIVAAPADLEPRFHDLHKLFCAAANSSPEKAAALLRLRHLCGRPGMAAIIRRLVR